LVDHLAALEVSLGKNTLGADAGRSH